MISTITLSCIPSTVLVRSPLLVSFLSAVLSSWAALCETSFFSLSLSAVALAFRHAIAMLMRVYSF